VSSLADLRPGDVGFGPISGIAGVGVRAGELLVVPVSHWRTWGKWRKVAHCGTVTQAATPGWTSTIGPLFNTETGMSHGPMFAQAEPSGYEQIELGAEHWTPEWIYIRPNYRPGQAATVADYAEWMCEEKIPYGFEDYAAIAGHRYGIKSQGLDDFIARVGANGLPVRAICSQGVDAQLTLAGGLDRAGHVFNDGRLPQDVIPSELYLRLLELGPVAVFRPGPD
jgi:hypothetical protein